MMITYAQKFLKDYPIGTILSKEDFAGWLEDLGLIFPVDDDWDRNQLVGYEQNLHKIRNEMNNAALSLETSFRLDVYERNKSLIVRSLKDAIIYDSRTYIEKLIQQTKNKIYNVELMLYSVEKEKMSNRERELILRSYEMLVDDLETILYRLDRMSKRRHEHA